MQSFGSVELEVLTDDEEGVFHTMDSPAKAARTSLGSRRSSLQPLPELKALHTAVLQPAMQHMRAAMLEIEIQPFRVLPRPCIRCLAS